MDVKHRLLIVLLALGFLVFHSWDLTRYPLATDDEVLLNEPGRVLALHGTMATPLLSRDHTPQPLVIQPPVHAIGVAMVYRALGFGMWQTRFASLLWGTLAVVALCLIAVNDLHLPPSAAVVTVGLLIIHPHFNLVSRMGRMDALCIALVLFAWFSYRAGLRRASPTLFFAAGILTAAACATHFVALGFAAGLGAAIVLRQPRRPSYVVLYVLGGFAVAAVTTSLLLLAGDNALNLLFEHGSMRSSRGSISKRLTEEVSRWGDEMRLAPGLVTCYVAAMIATLRIRVERASQGDLVVVCAAMVSFNALVMSKASGYYPLYPSAVLTVLVGSVLGGFSTMSRVAQRIWVALLVLAFVTAFPRLVVPRLVAASVQRDARDYQRVARELRRLIPSGTRVWTAPEGWYALALDHSVRTGSLGIIPRPHATIDDYAVVGWDTPLTDRGFVAVGGTGLPVPRVLGNSFASGDYRLRVYRSIHAAR